MVNAAPKHWLAPMSGSALARFLERRSRHPDEFDCAVRVISGEVPGESARWKYRRTAVDQLVLADAVVTINHGPRIRLRINYTGTGPERPSGLRPLHVAWAAVEVDTGAQLQIAADVGEAHRLFAPE